MQQDTVSYKCQNCGSPLTFEVGQSQTICPHCRSQNQMTIGTDGQITLSLVQKIDAIDTKTDQILDTTQQTQRTAASGHMLQTVTSEYQYYLQNDYKEKMEEFGKEENKPPSCAFGCVGAVLGFIGTFIVLTVFGVPLNDARGNPNFTPLIGLVGGAIATMVLVWVLKYKSIQEKKIPLNQKKTDFEKQIEELKKAISAGN
jgi:uncharacterized Zn finger protein (UPF0148 family)